MEKIKYFGFWNDDLVSIPIEDRRYNLELSFEDTGFDTIEELETIWCVYKGKYAIYSCLKTNKAWGEGEEDKPKFIWNWVKDSE